MTQNFTQQVWKKALSKYRNTNQQVNQLKNSRTSDTLSNSLSVDTAVHLLKQR